MDEEQGQSEPTNGGSLPLPESGEGWKPDSDQRKVKRAVPWLTKHRFVKGDPRRINCPKGVVGRKKREEAHRLLLEQAPESVRGVIELTQPVRGDVQPCPVCGRGMLRPEEIRLKANIAVLDRAGIGPSSKVEVQQSFDASWVQFMPGERLEQIEAWVMEAREAEALEGDPDTPPSENNGDEDEDEIIDVIPKEIEEE